MTALTSFAETGEALDRALAATPASFLAEEDPRRSTDEFTFFTFSASSVGLRGSGSYRIGGYLSVPTSPGPHPAILELPRHGSVNHTPHSNERERYVVLTLMHRGQRRADVPFRAPYPGLLLLDLEEDWILRGILADCLRGLELLQAQDAVDPRRIGVVGDDLGILVAARRPGLAGVRVDSLLLSGMWERASGTRAYPLEEINDLLRARPAEASALRARTDALDPVTAAAEVAAPTLVSGSAQDATVQSLLARLPAGEAYEPTGQDRHDDDGRDAWMAARLGVPARSRFLDAPIPL